MSHTCVMFTCRHSERIDAAANIVWFAGRQRRAAAGRAGRAAAAGSCAPGRPSARRHGRPALRTPRRVQGAALPAAALRLPEEPPSLPLRRLPAAPAASAPTLPTSSDEGMTHFSQTFHT